MKITVIDGLPEPHPGITAAKDKPRIARNAAPQAIRAKLKAAQSKRNQWDREVSWLEGLLEERLAQVEAGEWPFPPEPEPEWPPRKSDT